MTDLSKLSDAELERIAGGGAAAPVATDPDMDMLVRTVWGEARGEPAAGRKAVASVIRNRARLSNQPISAVVKAEGQFEPWADPTSRSAMEALDPNSEDYQAIARDIAGDDDPTGGATHFYSPQAQAALGRKAPDWDDGSGFDIGGHRFFRGSYGGAPEAGSPADVAQISDEELERIAGSGGGGKPTVEIGDVVFTSSPKTAMSARQPFVYAGSDQSVTPEQAAFYDAQIGAGKLNPGDVRAGKVKAGTEDFPLAQRNPEDLPQPGEWYLSPTGEKRQVPPDPWARTALAALAGPGIPTLGALLPGLTNDDRFQAMVRGGQSGLLLGGRNEAVAALESLAGLGEGVPGVVDRFKGVLKSEDAASGQARRDFPRAYDAAAVAGALGGGAAIPSLSAAGTAARLGLNAGIGGASGFLSTDGDLGDRTLGGLVGAGAGVAIPALASKAAGVAADLTGVPLRAANGSRGEVKAAQAAERALQRDEVAGVPSLTGPALPFQSAGDNLTALAEVVAQSPGKGQKIVRGAVRDQQAGASGRVKSELADAFSANGDYFDQLDGMMAKRKAETAPLRDQAFSTPIEQKAYDEKIAPVMKRVPQRALNYAAEAARLDGFDPVQIGFEVSPASGDLPVMVRIKQPSMQALHYVKKGLDQELASFRDALGRVDTEGNPLAGLTSNVRGDLGRAMREASEPYDQYMKAWGDESGQISALRLGRDVFSSSPEMGTGRLRKEMADWSEAQRAMYMKGVGEALVSQVRSTKGGVGAARQLLKSEEIADRIKLALPDDSAYGKFMGAMEREVDIANRNNRVVGGSPTYARQAARADLEQQARDPLDMAAEAIDTGLSPVRLGGKALKAALNAIPRKDRSVIGDPAANEALARALVEPDEMTRLLNMLQVYQAKRSVPLRQVPARLGGQVGASVATQPQ